MAALATQQEEASASIAALRLRVADTSVGDSELSALRVELTERVTEVGVAATAAAESLASGIEVRLESGLAEVNASSVALESTVAMLTAQQEEASASIAGLASQSSTLRDELTEQVAEADAAVQESNLRVEVVEGRLEGELAAVVSAMAVSGAEATASSDALESTVAALATQQAALREELSAHCLDALQSSVVSLSTDVQQIAAGQTEAAMQVGELTSGVDAHEVATNVSLAVVEDLVAEHADLVAEHAQDLRAVRQDLDAVQAAVCEQ